MNGIQVSADGFVHVGQNQGASLEKIQAAVLQKQNPGLQANCPDGTCPSCEQRMNREYVDYDEELELIEAMPSPRHPPQKKRKQVANEQEHLPLPVMNFKKPDDRKESKIHVNDSDEHLPLPTMARR